MSTKPSFIIAASQVVGNPRLVHRDYANLISVALSVRTKVAIAISVVVLALLYAKGVTLMIDAADKPSHYATFLNRAD